MIGQGEAIKSTVSQQGPSLEALELEVDRQSCQPSLVTEAVTCNSLEALAVMFQQVKKVSWQEENEAYLQKGVKKRRGSHDNV